MVLILRDKVGYCICPDALNVIDISGVLIQHSEYFAFAFAFAFELTIGAYGLRIMSLLPGLQISFLVHLNQFQEYCTTCFWGDQFRCP